MTTAELIQELRDQAEVEDPGTLYHLLQEAADRLEGLDERVCIVSEFFASAEELQNRIDAELLAADAERRRLKRMNLLHLATGVLLLIMITIMLLR